MAANRILIAEDDRIIAEAIALNLDYAGYEYLIFDDGAKAAAFLEADHFFDLALLDIMLPGFIVPNNVFYKRRPDFISLKNENRRLFSQTAI